MRSNKPLFVVEQELPDAETAFNRARACLEAPSQTECRVCPHLQRVLPHALDLDFVKTDQGWMLRNPVHALHLASQLEGQPWTSSAHGMHALRSKEDPILYGEEQERLLAMQTPGFSESWHPWIGPETNPGMDRPEMPEAQHQALLNTMGFSSTTTVTSSTSPKTVGSTTSSSGATTVTSGDAKAIAPSDTVDPTVSAATTIAATTTTQEPGAAAVPSTDAPRIISRAAAALPTSGPSSLNPSAMPPPPSLSPQPTSSSSSLIPSTALQGASATTSTQQQPTSHSPDKLPISATFESQTKPPTSAPPAVGAPPQGPVQGTKPSGTSSTAIGSGTSTLASVPNKIPEARYWALTTQEDQIRYLRRNFLAPRSSLAAAAAAKKKSAALKKRKTEAKPLVLTALPAWRQAPRPPIQLSHLQEATWKDVARHAQRQVQVWMDHFRCARKAYWQAVVQGASPPKQQAPRKRLFGSFLEDHDDEDEDVAANGRPCCMSCQSSPKKPQKRGWSVPLSRETETPTSKKPEWLEDDLMQCLECSFVGCAPRSVATLQGSPEHIVEHFFLSNHSMGVTCGPRARVYCFKCGDFVYHKVFDDERDRLDLVANLPWQAWKDHPVQRSFDAFRFFHEGQGITWRGMFATYPQLVLSQHVRMAKACRLRQAVMTGDLRLPLSVRPRALELAALQNRQSNVQVRTPVGIYNLGNTCFQSAILQCLIHCVPVQRYFLNQVGHDHQACAVYRELEAKGKLQTKAPAATKTADPKAKDAEKAIEVCLACELDKLMLRYYGSSIGFPVFSAVTELSREENKKTPDKAKETIRGDPLTTTEMLTAAWKCSGMQHLAGYEQRDAHEFLHAFLEQLGKHTERYRVLMRKAINVAVPNNVYLEKEKHTQDDMIKSLFEGTLRSVLVCQECGSKRIQTEKFMSISLPLSKEVQRLTAGRPGESNESVGRVKLSVERCLRHFTMPEMLADPVDCPCCAKKTPTKKQHVVSRLPKVLCLHLKRFDAAQNKKIEDFVSFPAHGLNMGSYLPHWCEVERVPVKDEGPLSDHVIPRIEYNLFGTVNHFGNLQSGHYVNNVKINDQWYHCNDAHIVAAGEGDGERQVLQSDGAYLLFYYRQ